MNKYTHNQSEEEILKNEKQQQEFAEDHDNFPHHPKNEQHIIYGIDANLTHILKDLCKTLGSSKKDEILRGINTIMANQEEFAAELARATAATETLTATNTALTAAVLAERDQVAAYIAANPALDTSALEGVVAGLESAVAAGGSQPTDVEGIFTPPEAPPVEEV